MTVSDLQAQLRFITNQTTASLSDTDSLRVLNIYFAKLVQSIVDINEDFFGEYSTFDLVNGQREYTLPLDYMKIKRLELAYDGTNWYKAIPLTEHSSQVPIDDSNPTVVDSNFDTDSPFYHVYDSSFFIYPRPSVNIQEGGKLWYIQQQIPLIQNGTEGTVTIPKEFHYLIPEGASADVFRRLGQEQRAQIADSNFARGEAMMKAKLSGRNLDDSMRLVPEIQSYK